MASHQLQRAIRAQLQFRDEPDNIAIVKVARRMFAGPANGVEEWSINGNSQLGGPTAEGGDLDFELGHESFRA